MLQNQKSNFDSFCTKFLELKEQLFNNWINGSDRPKTLSDFEEFENNILEFKKIFNDTEQGLSSVVANLQQI